METIIAAAIGASGTVLAAWLTRRRQQKSLGKGNVQQNLDPVTRIVVILNLGFTITLCVIVILLAQGEIKRIESKVASKTLRDFSESLADIDVINKTKMLDTDAKAILDGAGPKTINVAGRSWSTGDVVYVNEWEWVDEIYPYGGRKNLTFRATCGLVPTAKLTIRGFSVKRQSALVEYTAPDNRQAGTPCDTGVYFFYRLK